MKLNILNKKLFDNKLYKGSFLIYKFINGEILTRTTTEDSFRMHLAANYLFKHFSNYRYSIL